MATQRAAPFGSWSSPITAELIVLGAKRLGDLVLDGESTWLTESRPAQRGCSVLVQLRDGEERDCTAEPFDARTRVHEYGGGALAAADGVAYVSNAADGRVYRVTVGAAPEPITPASALRYAALTIDSPRRRLMAVVEDHTREGSEPENRLVSLPLDGSGATTVLVSGADFYAAPRLSPDGRELAYLAWHHPNMPWDGTELWIAALDASGAVRSTRRVAGGPTESIFQPEWGADGTLYYVSDASGYWNLWRAGAGAPRPLHPKQAEFGLPLWNLGMSTYAALADGRLLCSWVSHGHCSLGLLQPESGVLEAIALPYTELSNVRADAERAVFGAAGPSTAPCLVELDLRTREHRVLRQFSAVEVDPAYVSEPRALSFATSDGMVAHALYYVPKNPAFTSAGPSPLLVKSHGGPTAAASSALNPRTQFYTSRGIAVLDVDYRGSTGYGRAYREQLDGRWGVADVDDCVNGALHLCELGEADPARLMISGGSAGGFTTLAALTFRKVFKAGASHYGVSDLEALARDTHKFEARYLDRLIGPYPARKDLYRARSPLYHAEALDCPVVFFQGLEDRVVPPSQTEAMVAALRRKGVAVAYVPFAGEHHGFRRAENIRRAIEAELAFFARVLGFELADALEIEIENL